MSGIAQEASEFEQFVEGAKILAKNHGLSLIEFTGLIIAYQLGAIHFHLEGLVSKPKKTRAKTPPKNTADPALHY